MGKVPCLKTVGELKKALEKIPDDTVLAIEDMGLGYGLKPPYLAQYQWQTSMHMGYVSESEAAEMRKDETKAKPYKMDRPVCVVAPHI
jgi:hypothetical protein